MSNQAIDKHGLAGIKADYLARHGMELDDWSAMVLLDNRAQFQRMGNQLSDVLEQNQKLNSRIRESVKTVQFKSFLEAFVHGAGKSFPYAFTALVLGILYYVYITTYTEYDKIKRIVDSYQNAADYEHLIREGLTETDGTIEYLILEPSRDGKFVFGKSYEFDAKRKLVKVPLKRIN